MIDIITRCQGEWDLPIQPIVADITGFWLLALLDNRLLLNAFFFLPLLAVRRLKQIR